MCTRLSCYSFTQKSIPALRKATSKCSGLVLQIFNRSRAVHHLPISHPRLRRCLTLCLPSEDDTSGLIFFEDDEGLRPMSDEEFSALEQQWSQPQSEAMFSTGTAGDKPEAKSSNIPFYRRHQMVTYIDQIRREIAQESEKH